jgi:thiol:disulfide interchange protein
MRIRPMMPYRLMLLLGFLLIQSQLPAQGIVFESGYLKSVFAKADSLKRPVFVDVFTTWCRPCHYLNDSVFSNDSLGQFVNQYFVSVQLDAEAGEGIAFARSHGVTAYPTLMVLGPDGKLWGEHKGVLEARALQIWLATVSTRDQPTIKRAPKKRRSRGR